MHCIVLRTFYPRVPVRRSTPLGMYFSARKNKGSFYDMMVRPFSDMACGELIVRPATPTCPLRQSTGFEGPEVADCFSSVQS